MKTDSLDARLKASEEAIASHVEALQTEVEQTGREVRDFVLRNPWVGVTGALLGGVAVGLLLGKRRGPRTHRDVLDRYLDGLSDIARSAGATDEEVSVLLRDALRESMPPVVIRGAKEGRGGVAGKIFGIVSGIAFDMAKSSLMRFMDQRLSAGAPATNESKDRGEVGNGGR